MRRHDHDAAGDPALLAAKSALREEIWSLMSVKGVARFPAPDGRIPNFVGAEAAAQLLATTTEWARAATVKANPDSPQWPARQRALEDGKLLFMAVPRLSGSRPFFLLDPVRLPVSARAASSIRGASQAGSTVDISDLEPVDLVLTGCVAVGRDGARLGKGGGFSDLELAVAADAGLVDRRTIVATTVHGRQVVDRGRVPHTEHDIHVDVIVTPEQVLRCPRRRDHRLPSIQWNELSEEKIASIPLLARLRSDVRNAGGQRP